MFTKEFPLSSPRGWASSSHQSRVSGDLEAGDNSFRWLCPLERGLHNCSTPQPPWLWHGIGGSSHGEGGGCSVLLLREWLWQYPPPIPHPHLLESGPFSLLHVTSMLHTNVLHFLLLMWVWVVVSSQGTRKIWFLRCSKSYSLRQCHNPFAGAITKYPRLGIKKEVYEAYVVLGLASTRTWH